VKAYIGTSGWQYKHWGERFYPKELKPGQWLEYYMEHFSTLEVNSTFYRSARLSTFEKWRGTAERVNKKFIFALKLNRYFTHRNRLKISSENREFLRGTVENMSHLGKHFGPLLVQLPPQMKADLPKLEDFLQEIKNSPIIPGTKLRVAVEFRHPSWLKPETYAILKKAKAAFVISDSPAWPTEVISTADFCYVRFHGKPVIFASPYAKNVLRSWKKKIFSLPVKAVYAYFNDDVNAYAIDGVEYLNTITRG
jgi:uncharacterized protein YecE (DUF72 family)